MGGQYSPGVGWGGGGGGGHYSHGGGGDIVRMGWCGRTLFAQGNIIHSDTSIESHCETMTLSWLVRIPALCHATILSHPD